MTSRRVDPLEYFDTENDFRNEPPTQVLACAVYRPGLTRSVFIVMIRTAMSARQMMHYFMTEKWCVSELNDMSVSL